MPQIEPLNPRAVPGSNQAPDFAQIVTDRIASEYAEFKTTLADMRSEADKLPNPVTSDDDALASGALIKRFRDLDSRVEAVRIMEKEPYLRGGNAVDSWFNVLRDMIGKRNKNDRSAKPGIADVLQARINDYQDRKLAAERARLAAQQAEAARVAQEAARKAAEEARQAEEARLSAERARKPENIVTKNAAAVEQERRAIEAQIEAKRQADQAEEARLDTLASAADLVRTRGSDSSGAGVLLTSQKEPYALLVDRNKVDMNALRPYFTEAEIEKALRGWAKATGHRTQMEGAEIGHRNKGVTR